MELWKRFAELYKGYEHGYGSYEIQGQDPSGKMRGKALTHRGATPQKAWEDHLAGGVGLGQIPILEDNTCYWGAIDIDVKNIDIQHLERMTRIKSIPVVVCRSKSAGAHCYIFLKEPVPAKDLIQKLEEWAAALGHGGCEIFPKQSYRTDPSKDVGNWINLPYHNVEMCNRTAFANDKDLSFEEFLDFAESMKQEPGRIYEQEQIVIQTEVDTQVKEIFKLGEGYCPPCIEMMLSNGPIEEGGRNNVLTHSMVFLKKAYAESWKTLTQKLNVLMFVDALPHDEVADSMKSVDKKGYEYLCKMEPMRSHCDKAKCKQARFGVGESGTGERSIEFAGIVKYVSPSNVCWRVDILLDGKKYHLLMDTDILQNQSKFAKQVLEAATRYPPSMPHARWASMVDEALVNNVQEVFIPEEASMEGEFWSLFDAFLTGNIQAKTRDEILSGKPWDDGEGTIWFRIGDVKDYLTKKKFSMPSQEWLWMQLRSWYENNKYSEESMRKQFNIKGKIARCWGVPTKHFKTVDKHVGEAAIIKGEEF